MRHAGCKIRMKVKAMQLQLPWEVSESTSQLLTVFRGEVKKFGSSRNIWSVLPGGPMLNVWHQDSCSSQDRSFPSPVHGTWIFPQGRMSLSSRDSSSSLPKPFHAHRKYLLVLHRFPSGEISLPHASLFRFIYLCATSCFPCQRGVTSPWATKLLGQI